MKMCLKRVMVRNYEQGLLFHDGEFRGVLEPGVHWFLDLMDRLAVDVVSRRAPRLLHDKLDLIAASGELKGRAVVLDLKDDQRGLVWIDCRFALVLTPGLHAFWTGFRDVRVETVDARLIRFEHPELQAILRAPGSNLALEGVVVNRNCVGVLFVNGRYQGELTPGQYAFWRGVADVRVVETDLRETSLDVAGQEIMTADKVTLRLNLVVNYRVADARRAIAAADDARQALYREAQLALRAVVGARELDNLLADKDSLGQSIEAILERRAGELGLAIASVGVRDLILPGDMKELMNRVTEARKAAEANLITRREETAALRSQANTARLLAENPTLMRLRELEVVEKLAASGKLQVVLGEKSLSDRVLNIL